MFDVFIPYSYCIKLMVKNRRYRYLRKGGKKVFSNSILQFILFFNNLPTEIHQQIIVFLQLFVILAEILSFFYIRHITKNY